MHHIDTHVGEADASPPATSARVNRSALPLLVICSVVGIGLILDRATAHSAATIHDPRSPLMAILAVALGCLGWRTRDQLARIGQAGFLLYVAGATSNLVCLVTDPDGVSDYLHIQAHGLLLSSTSAISPSSQEQASSLPPLSTAASRTRLHRPHHQPIPPPTRTHNTEARSWTGSL